MLFGAGLPTAPIPSKVVRGQETLAQLLRDLWVLGAGLPTAPFLLRDLSLEPTIHGIRNLVANEPEHVEKPEPRWHAFYAILAVGGIYLALPRALVVGPIWLIPALIVILLVPTVITHRTGRHSLNHLLGIIINSIITLSLIGSVVLLVTALPSHKEPPLRLLGSGAALWVTNVLVFALWYWRLDGHGPTARLQRKEFGSRSFVFPQMQIEKQERGRFGCEQWRPRFIDYLFVAFTQSSTFGPTDAPLLARWVKLLTMVQVFISLSIVILLISRAVGVL